MMQEKRNETKAPRSPGHPVEVWAVLASGLCPWDLEGHSLTCLVPRRQRPEQEHGHCSCCVDCVVHSRHRAPREGGWIMDAKVRLMTQCLLSCSSDYM